jgi:tryptophanase
VVSSAQQESTPSDRRSRSAAFFGRAGEPWPLEMTRLAIPRRAYTESQLCYVAAVLADMYVRRGTIPGLRLIAEEGELRHFNPDSRR